jgi:hypothetical protein
MLLHTYTYLPTYLPTYIHTYKHVARSFFKRSKILDFSSALSRHEKAFANTPTNNWGTKIFHTLFSQHVFQPWTGTASGAFVILIPSYDPQTGGNGTKKIKKTFTLFTINSYFIQMSFKITHWANKTNITKLKINAHMYVEK